MSDGVNGGGSIEGDNRDTPPVRMVLGMTFTSTTGTKGGALPALKAVVQNWADEYGVTVQWDGPRPV